MDQLFASVPAPMLELIHYPASLPLATTMLLGADDVGVPMSEAREKLAPAFESLGGTLRFAMLAALCDQAVGLSVADKEPLVALLDRMETSAEPDDWYQHAWIWLLRHSLGTLPEEPESVSLDNEQITWSARVVLSMVCLCDGETGMSDYEFLRGWVPLGLGETQRIPGSELTWEEFLTALTTLSAAPPQSKQLLLVSVANTVSGDSEVSPEESVVVQVIRKILLGDQAWLAPTTA